jgi:adenylate cyclase
MNFFEELKRRNVYRVATAYVVVAWVLVQAADTLFPIFEFPDQALRTFTVLLFLGFPLVLVLSWMFEFTAQGLRRTSAADNESVPLGGNDYAVTLLLVVLVGFMAVQQFADAP